MLHPNLSLAYAALYDKSDESKLTSYYMTKNADSKYISKINNVTNI